MRACRADSTPSPGTSRPGAGTDRARRRLCHACLQGGQYSITRYNLFWCWHRPRKATTLSCVPAGRTVLHHQVQVFLVLAQTAQGDDIVMRACRADSTPSPGTSRSGAGTDHAGRQHCHACLQGTCQYEGAAARRCSATTHCPKRHHRLAGLQGTEIAGRNVRAAAGSQGAAGCSGDGIPHSEQQLAQADWGREGQEAMSKRAQVLRVQGEHAAAALTHSLCLGPPPPVALALQFAFACANMQRPHSPPSQAASYRAHLCSDSSPARWTKRSASLRRECLDTCRRAQDPQRPAPGTCPTPGPHI